jgi:hypothetical protein
MPSRLKSSGLGDPPVGASKAPRGGDASTKLLTTDEVIDRLLEDANLRRVAATCVLPGMRIGSTWLFRESDLEEWIRRQRPEHENN